MEDVLDQPIVAKTAKKRKNFSQFYGEKHPYLTPEFWLDEKNQFWKKKPGLYKQEAYDHILDRCRLELKENFIN
jgi:hypothetical protein